MKRHVAALFSNGKIKLVEDTVPPLTKGMVRIKTICSLVSPGSELKGWDALAKQRINPETVVSQKKFGYSITGIIDAIGDNVSSRLEVGLRVVAIGAGYAQHSDYVVVPQNLCIEVPKKVKSSDASYAMLIATALQVLRRTKPEIGEYYLVCGLGIVGLLTAKLLQLNGCKVLGIDNHSTRVELAKKWGIDQVVLDSDLEYDKKLDSFTEKEGFDGAVLAFGGRADGPLDRIVKHMRLCPDSHHTGNIVVVGWPIFSYEGEIGNMNNNIKF